MQVVPVLFEEYFEPINYSNIWDLSDPGDIHSRFDTYISKSRLLGSWGSHGTLDESFLTII